MRAFLDEVRYNDQGNEVTLIKRRTAVPELLQTSAGRRAKGLG
jgi:hypothetical protein